MKLSEAYSLLVEDGVSDNHRYFAEVYKLYQFRDDQLLKDYLEFIIREPVSWFRGFPAKLTTKTSFSKPKTAVIKLLKHDTVIDELGEEYVQRVHDVVWKTYKQCHEEILETRQKTKSPTAKMTVMDHFDVESYESLPVPSGPKIASKPFYVVEKEKAQAKENEISVEDISHTHEIEEESIVHLNKKIKKLKEIIHHLTKHMNDGVSDAFQILLEEL